MTDEEAPALVVLAAGLARRYGGCKPLAPIGPGGEAVIDLLASDAVAAGFGHIVLVLHPETGPAVRYHVEQCWPPGVAVSFTEQRLPLGTVHAVLAARDAIGPHAAFGVSNADDVYGERAMGQLVHHLVGTGDEHVLIGYELRTTVSTGDPVTRGICIVDADGHLSALTERRHILRHDGGDVFTADDGLQPVELDGSLPTSVNLWGFQPSIWEVLASAMDASGLDEEDLVARAAGGEELPKTEVLLPEVVAGMVESAAGLPVRVLPTGARLLGVTDAADLPVVSAELAREVAGGVRAPYAWDSVER